LTPEWIRDVQLHTDWAAVYGLKHVAYEGGPTLDTTGHKDGVKAAAVRDPRMTTAIVNQHDAWIANGEGLLTYYVVAWDYQWGFTDDIANLATPKYRGARCAQLAAARRAYVRHVGVVNAERRALERLFGCRPMGR
jgi:hypothetical protein